MNYSKKEHDEIISHTNKQLQKLEQIKHLWSNVTQNINNPIQFNRLKYIAKQLQQVDLHLPPKKSFLHLSSAITRTDPIKLHVPMQNSQKDGLQTANIIYNLARTNQLPQICALKVANLDYLKQFPENSAIQRTMVNIPVTIYFHYGVSVENITEAILQIDQRLFVAHNYYGFNYTKAFCAASDIPVGNGYCSITIDSENAQYIPGGNHEGIAKRQALIQNSITIKQVQTLLQAHNLCSNIEYYLNSIAPQNQSNQNQFTMYAPQDIPKSAPITLKTFIDNINHLLRYDHDLINSCKNLLLNPKLVQLLQICQHKLDELDGATYNAKNAFMI